MSPTTELEPHDIRQDDATLRYVTAGKAGAPLIVLIHPAFADHRCFDDQVATLAGAHRLALVDLFGHGASQASGSASLVDNGAMIAAIIEREGAAAAHLVGVSLGALIAQDVAARYPRYVQSLTVVGGYPIHGTSREVQREQAGEMAKWLFLVLFSMPRFRRYVARTSVLRPDAQERFYRSAQAFTRRSFRAMAGMDRLFRSEEVPLAHPLQILVGDHERPLLRTLAERWHRQTPSSAFHVIPDAGHCANMDNPAEFNAQLLDFVRWPAEQVAVTGPSAHNP